MYWPEYPSQSGNSPDSTYKGEHGPVNGGLQADHDAGAGRL
jgi:hypothetical protein